MKTTIALAFTLLPLDAQDADLAKQLANPISSLISVPIQSSSDHGGALRFVIGRGGRLHL